MADFFDKKVASGTWRRSVVSVRRDVRIIQPVATGFLSMGDDLYQNRQGVSVFIPDVRLGQLNCTARHEWRHASAGLPGQDSIQPTTEATTLLPPDLYSRTSPDDDWISGAVYDGIWPR
jgi:hypothetical protein